MCLDASYSVASPSIFRTKSVASNIKIPIAERKQNQRAPQEARGSLTKVGPVYFITEISPNRARDKAVLARMLEGVRSRCWSEEAIADAANLSGQDRSSSSEPSDQGKLFASLSILLLPGGCTLIVLQSLLSQGNLLNPARLQFDPVLGSCVVAQQEPCLCSMPKRKVSEADRVVEEYTA